MTILHILILAIIQGAAELLPVSSSAHVIVAEKLLGLDPTRPEMTLLLVMLHTGTMFAVICFYWKVWRATFFGSRAEFARFLRLLVAASALTGVVGLGLKLIIEKVALKGVAHAEVEMIFGNLTLISASLAVVGGLICYSGLKSRRPKGDGALDLAGACCMGAIQGLCLPFRGFSRSGATISTGLILGLSRRQVEAFSFALAVVLTPPVIGMEVLRALKAQHAAAAAGTTLMGLFVPSLIGMVLSFGTGLLALRWLSAWLERGRWHLFGIYCLCASMVTFVLSWSGM
jgi:undecaprenyl-diphosphatase